ncbi:MAG TPA: polyamine ABC transporter substrate-binding protein [Azospirillaceae bacterium]|nr:polyamine ABC transporter substrate-binding protein [Azospirillaceae bacterium]
MTKRFASFLLGAVATVAFSTAGHAADKVVNIYNWNDYIGETTLEGFTKATGVKTNYDVYDSLEILEQKVLVGKSGYDVIVPTAEPTLAKMIEAKAVQKLDKTKIPNLQNLDPALMKRLETTDPGNEYAAIYQWGTIGIGLLPEKIKEVAPDVPLDSWDLLFKPEYVSKVAKCGVTLLDSPTDVIPTALHYLGLDPNSEKKEDLAKVEKLLSSIRPHIKTFVTGSTINNLAGGDTCVVMSYSGDALQAKARASEANTGVTVDYVVPNEGVQLWFDVMAIPADAPHPEEAHAFINYALQPEVMAGISNFVQYANAVPASLPSVDEAVRNNPSIFPTEQMKAKMFTLKGISQAADRQRTRLWTKIKTGK